MNQLLATTTDPIVLRLLAAVRDSPDLRDAVQVYETILPLLRDADLHVTPIAITADQARGKLEMGLPLLQDVDLELDVKAACELMLQLARALATIPKPLARAVGSGRPDSSSGFRPDAAALNEADPEGSDALTRATAARQIRSALEDNNLDLAALLPHVAAGDREFVASLGQSQQLDAALVWTLAQNTLKPALRAWRRQLANLVEGIPWRKGYCYVCGAGATLGELQESLQVMHLRCGQCGADWQFPRLQCMYCGNQDHKTLGFLYAETQPEKMRVEVCDQCHGYLKVIAAFSPTPPELLAVEDLATLHLDYIAQARGYERVAIQIAAATVAVGF